MEQQVIYSIQHITKEFPGVKALDDVSIDVRRGEILALVGENGAGKSTLMNILSGAYAPSSGKLVYEGQELTALTPDRAQKLGIAMIHQELSLSNALSVAENIFEGHLPKTPLGLVDYRRLLRDSKVLLEEVGLPHLDPRTLVRDINVSQQQMVEIAKALSLDAKFLILDEPTQGIDIGAKNEIYEIIDEMVRQGASVIMVSSEMQETISLCDRILVMYEGQIAGELYHRDATEQNIVTLMAGQQLAQSAN